MLYQKLPTTFGFSPDEILNTDIIKTLLSTYNNEPRMPLLDPSAFPDLSKNISSFFGSRVVKFRLFYYPPMYSTNVHIDGNRLNPVFWALNFPLFGTENSVMEWAKIKDDATPSITASETYDSKSVYFDESAVEYFYKDALTLTAPHIVNTIVPHRASNMKETPRAILSVRLGLSSETKFGNICNSILKVK